MFVRRLREALRLKEPRPGGDERLGKSFGCNSGGLLRASTVYRFGPITRIAASATCGFPSAMASPLRAYLLGLRRAAIPRSRSIGLVQQSIQEAWRFIGREILRPGGSSFRIDRLTGLLVAKFPSPKLQALHLHARPLTRLRYCLAHPVADVSVGILCLQTLGSVVCVTLSRHHFGWRFLSQNRYMVRASVALFCSVFITV
jgi:hypothetical protein